MLAGSEQPTAADAESTESVEAFRRRARKWLGNNFERVDANRAAELHDYELAESVRANRAMMAALFDADLSGICYPQKFGGLGLTIDHLRAFTEESRGYGLPMMFHLPTMAILAATLLDFATEDQKSRHIPAILRGDELWVQFLSEPSGGSDLAGVLTRATRDGDSYIVNGSKIWSSGAFCADYALCVCRTNWDVPKHQGLSALIMKVHQPGITIDQIRQVNGTRDFCQEFFDDVRIPVSQLVGDENDGWTITTRLLQHEKVAVGGGSPFGIAAVGVGRRLPADAIDYMVALIRSVGRTDDPTARQALGEAVALSVTQQAMVDWLSPALSAGRVPPSTSALLKLFEATATTQRAELAARIAGPAIIGGSDLADEAGVQFLARQGVALAGGSNEIQRNIISERLLGMPREPAHDKDTPFGDVPRTGLKR
jgi:alkylation response protein AidB-like acyl-CoA dehydrogenase